MKKYHVVEHVRFDADNLMMRIDGKERQFSLPAVSTKLTRASQHERDAFEVSPSGYGIHWPRLDEDLSIDGLLKEFHGRPHPKQSKHVLTSR